MQVKSCLKQTKICLVLSGKAYGVSYVCVINILPPALKSLGLGPVEPTISTPYLKIRILMNCPGSSQCCLWMVIAPVLAPIQIFVRGSSPGGYVACGWLAWSTLFSNTVIAALFDLFHQSSSALEGLYNVASLKCQLWLEDQRSTRTLRM